MHYISFLVHMGKEIVMVLILNERQKELKFLNTVKIFVVDFLTDTLYKIKELVLPSSLPSFIRRHGDQVL